MFYLFCISVKTSHVLDLLVIHSKEITYIWSLYHAIENTFL